MCRSLGIGAGHGETEAIRGKLRLPALRAPGTENLSPADAAVNLPAHRHSHKIAKLAAARFACGSFTDAASALARGCGTHVAAPAVVRALAIAAAADFNAFYDHAAPMISGDKTLPVISADGTGTVTRPGDLREATRKAAEHRQAQGRLAGGERPARKRMATIGAVYNAE